MLLRFTLITLLSSSTLLSLADLADGRSYRRHRRPAYAYSGARPVTGYGANLHRRFVLKQELKRAASGKSVRYRGNILWSR